MKSEPTTFSIDDLANKPQKISEWDGVRNYQARNFMQAMQIDDQAFFYHSSCSSPAIVGIMRIIKDAYPDKTALDPNSPYYDFKSSSTYPRWYCVDVQLIKKLEINIPLRVLKRWPELATLSLLRKGNRLSIMPVTSEQWHTILDRSSLHD